MLKPALVLAILATTPVFAQAAEATADTVVAKVNGEDITLGQMIAMKDGMGEDAVANLPPVALWDLMLDQMIRQTAVGQKKADKLTARDTAVLELDRRAYLAGAVLEQVAASEPSDEELRAVYEKAFGAETAPKTEFHAAHILVKTEDEAKAIEADLAKGEDFGKLAEEKSTDQASGPNKGELGWFQPEQMVAPFAEAVKTLKAGEISKPVETQFGWHVIKLIETRQLEAPKFEEVKDQLAVQVRRDRVEAEIQKSVADAKIEKTPDLSPELLNKTDLLEK
ncbi:peptidylprolyl isomerase [Paracoccus sp. (in: a-proteobacteria)]|uniref:peptidylprolyl isomerase n=1 Tax=Paracoccus sp. TaxID=267 RepID=UPI00289BBBAF|nr:peptidylprolyl isomerase [Paracoccus sp. (in: a-proteobacteria)]